MSAVAIGGNVLMFPRMFCVYLITNAVNGKVYVGKTNDLRARWIQHRYEARKLRGRRTHTSPIHLAINKYGEESFTIEPIEMCASHDEAYEAEAYWITWYRAFDGRWGYNASLGGEGSGGHVQSPELIEKRIGKIRGRKQTPEAVAARMAARIGVTPEEYATRRAAGDLRCSGLGVRDGHWIRPEDSYGAYRPVFASCRDCFNANRNARRVKSTKPRPRGYKRDRAAIIASLATRAGISPAEYQARIDSGLRHCGGYAVNDPHWAVASAFEKNKPVCTECRRAYRRAADAKKRAA